MTSRKDTSTNIKVMNRWIVVIGAIMIQVALGAIYAWSAFTGALQSEAFGFTKTMTQAIFSTDLQHLECLLSLVGDCKKSMAQ